MVGGFTVFTLFCAMLAPHTALAETTGLGVSPTSQEKWLVRGDTYTANIQLTHDQGDVTGLSTINATQTLPADLDLQGVPTSALFQPRASSSTLRIAVNTAHASIGTHVLTLGIQMPTNVSSTRGNSLGLTLPFQATLHIVTSTADLPQYIDATKTSIAGLVTISDVHANHHFALPGETVTLSWNVQSHSSATIMHLPFASSLARSGSVLRSTGGFMQTMRPPNGSFVQKEKYIMPSHEGIYSLSFQSGTTTKIMKIYVFRPTLFRKLLALTTLIGMALVIGGLIGYRRSRMMNNSENVRTENRAE